jgi:hypothetical protein
MNVKQQALRLGQAIQGKAIAFPVKLVTDNDNDPNIEWFEDSNGDHVDPYTVMLALNAAYGTPQSSIGESGAAEYELLDAAVAFIERNAASVFALEGFDRLSMAIHNHPGAHIKVEDRASRSATGAIRLADYINAADILASDAPHVVVEKLQAAVDRNAKNPRRYQARRVSP